MYEIRLASYKDSKELSILNYEFNEISIEPDLVSERIRISPELIAVATFNVSCIGFASGQVFNSFCYEYCQGEITEMYIQESHRCKGLASRLIELLENEMKLKGVKSIKILTGMSNQNALATYNKAGYNIENEAVLSKKI